MENNSHSISKQSVTPAINQSSTLSKTPSESLLVSGAENGPTWLTAHVNVKQRWEMQVMLSSCNLAKDYKKKEEIIICTHLLPEDRLKITRITKIKSVHDI